MAYILLIIFLILLIIIIPKVFDYDYLSPTFIYACSLLVSISCSCIGMLSWNNIKDLKPETMLIVMFSVLFFMAGEKCARSISKYKKDYSFEEKKVNIDFWKIILQIIVMIVVLVLMYKEVYRIALIGGYNGGGFGEIMSKYRGLSTLYTTYLTETGQNINVYISQFRKLCEIFCYIDIYILINNIYNKNKTIKNIGYAIVILLGFLLSILTGGRMQIVIYVVFALFITFYMLLKKYTPIDIIKKFYKHIIGMIIAMITLFMVMLPLSGRNNEYDIISYITFYFGAPIPSLELYLDEPTKPNYFGEETFRGSESIAFKLGLSNNIQPISKEWYKFELDDGKYLTSNIFTSGKRYYHDFGFIGVMILQFLFGFIFSALYMIAMYRKKPVFIIFIFMNFYIIIDQVRDDLFYSNFLYVNSIIYFLLLFVTYNFLVKFNFKERCKICVRNTQ